MSQTALHLYLKYFALLTYSYDGVYASAEGHYDLNRLYNFVYTSIFRLCYNLSLVLVPFFFYIHSPFHCSKLVTRVDLSFRACKVDPSRQHRMETGMLWSSNCCCWPTTAQHVLIIKYLAISSFSTCSISFLK